MTHGDRQLKNRGRRAAVASVGLFVLSGASVGLGWATQPVEVPLLVLLGLAVLPTAESSRAAAEAAEAIRRRFAPPEKSR